MHLKIGKYLFDCLRGKRTWTKSKNNKKEVKIIKSQINTSYSQFGEDKIIAGIFENLFNQRFSGINYLDIGSNHPIIDNNTYFFYEKGGKGVLIDANSDFANLTKRIRPNDIFLNCGIAFDSNKTADYYKFSIPGWNTFSEDRADYIIKNDSDKCQFIEKVNMELIDINDVILKYFPEKLDLLSIDVETLDFEVLKKIKFSNVRPKLICIEGSRDNEIIKYMNDNNYVMVADSFVNSIFADKTQYKN